MRVSEGGAGREVDAMLDEEGVGAEDEADEEEEEEEKPFLLW